MSGAPVYQPSCQVYYTTEGEVLNDILEFYDFQGRTDDFVEFNSEALAGQVCVFIHQSVVFYGIFQLITVQIRVFFLAQEHPSPPRTWTTSTPTPF